ncbi:sigma 54-interacting transcriptional regulator [Spongiimicrobium salis]|uniref:sigma 54-interacting transcriptional regulator n=1 Tax=Spongiimicrobium salis TaxID=1667022 RepID=UPI00374D4114
MASHSSNDIHTFLSEIPFFSEVSPASLEHFCEDLNRIRFSSGERIVEKDSPGHAMYVILDGKVRVHEAVHSYGYLGKGECFGEYALIDRQARSASVTAEEDTLVLEIERHHFVQLMQKDNGFAQGILTVMIKRHRELDQIQERLSSAKQSLEFANAKMSGLINGALDTIIMFDERFRIILTNPSAQFLLENTEVLQRNVLFFFDEASATHIESLVEESATLTTNTYLSKTIKVIGSKGKETLNEGTLSKFKTGKAIFYILILRDIEARIAADLQIEVLTDQQEYLTEEIENLTNTSGILTQDKGMLQVLQMVDQVAKTDATVLITGETGTGKELVARAIHQASSRSGKPLVRINCGAIPENLIESELFGHEKGAFTGAVADRKGRFLLADTGTLFLDEIGELPLALQPKLLRVIQEGEFDPVGSSKTLKVDVRIIAATHRNLLQFATNGKFREDLYYRLNVFPIGIPPLRERKNDILLIAQHMIDAQARKLHKKNITLTDDDKKVFTDYAWPGNVRELQNLIERAVIVAQNGMVDWNMIVPTALPHKKNDAAIPEDQDIILTYSALIAKEKENILKALKKTNWKVSGHNGAAALLGIPPTTLASKIKALKIVRPI